MYMYSLYPVTMDIEAMDTEAVDRQPKDGQSTEGQSIDGQTLDDEEPISDREPSITVVSCIAFSIHQ